MGCTPSVLDSEVNVSSASRGAEAKKELHNEEPASDGESASLLCANLRRNFASIGNGARPAQRPIVSAPGIVTSGDDQDQDSRLLNLLGNVCGGDEDQSRNTTTTPLTQQHQLPHYYLQHHHQQQGHHHQYQFHPKPHRKFSANISEKDFTKKDSIVSVSGFGNLSSGHGTTTTTTAIRNKGSGGGGGGVCPTFGRFGHRKSSLALTPEEEPFENVTHKPSIDSKYPFLLPPNPLLRVLFVFHKTDSVYEAMLGACQKIQGDATLVRNVQSAEDAFRSPTTTGYHLVIVDARYPKHLDPEALASTLRSTKAGQYTTFVAVVKKSAYEKEESTIFSYIDWGYGRCIIESSSLIYCYGELLQIHHGLVRTQNVMATQQATYTALNRTKQALIITDDHLRVQYSNRTTERLLNMRQDELLGHLLAEFFHSDLNTLQMQTSRNREFDGVLSIKRKASENNIVHVHAIPVVCIGSQPTHLVLTVDLSNSSNDMLPLVPTKEAGPRGSLHSIRRGSFDVRSVGSDGLRRTSLAKLNALPLEAPITHVVTILSQIQENCSLEEARLLDRVMEVLKREGLYTAQLKEIRMEDPIASDLIGALLTEKATSNNISSRRSSNDSIIRSGRTSSSVQLPRPKSSTQISNLLETAVDWDFDIFRLEEISEKRPLLYLGMELCDKFDVFETFNTDEATFKAWFMVIERNYQASNSYHNSCHAADVMQATAVFLQRIARRGDLKILDQMDEATALIAAATHDIDHPGKSSAFLCNSDDKLAVLYNDMSVLESHHAAMTFQLTLRDDKINIFKNLDRDTYKLARSMIIDMILATEMTRHFEHLAKFVSVFGNEVPETKEVLGPPEADENQSLIRRMLIKCADVSNPARPLRFCVEWAHRIANEYFNQTDEEKRLNLPIVMPMFDRATCSISKSQIGFIEYIIEDMMNAWDGFIDMPELLTHMHFNYQEWKQYEQQGINTLEDVKAKQKSLAETTSH